LVGCTILVMEDEPLIAMAISEALRDAGAAVMTADSLREAVPIASHPDLSAAVLDLTVADGDAAAVCEVLSARDIPFVLYSGKQPETVPAGCLYLVKPALSCDLVKAVERLLL
jgi:DNA-binding response OmpR family regulator